MADLSLFSFRPGRSFLHRLDARVKLLGLALVSLLSLGSGSVSLAVLSGLLAVLAMNCKLAFTRLAGELKVFFFLLLVVFVARALSTPGEVLWQWHAVQVTAEGLRAGGLMCWSFPPGPHGSPRPSGGFSSRCRWSMKPGSP